LIHFGHDPALFGEGWDGDNQVPNVIQIQAWLVAVGQLFECSTRGAMGDKAEVELLRHLRPTRTG
jgi:hypothetical protein